MRLNYSNCCRGSHRGCAVAAARNERLVITVEQGEHAAWPVCYVQLGGRRYGHIGWDGTGYLYTAAGLVEAGGYIPCLDIFSREQIERAARELIMSVSIDGSLAVENHYHGGCAGLF